LWCNDVIGGQLESKLTILCLFLDLSRRVEKVVFDKRLADRKSSCLEEGIRHGAADEERVDARDEVLNHLEFVRYLRPAKHRDERAIRMREDVPEILHFCRHQEACRRLLHVMDDAFG